MRRFTSLCFLLAALSFGLATPAHADDSSWWFGDSQPLDVTVNDAYLEVHSGPGRSFPIFHVVEKGELIRLLKKRTDWIKIATKRGKEGWVKRADLTLTLGPDNSAVSLNRIGMNRFVDRQWELGLTLGDFSGADSLGLNVGYRFADNLTLALHLAQATSAIADSKMAYLAVIHQPWPHWRASPFFGLGAGMINSSKVSALDQPLDANDNSLLITLGANVYLSRRFSARLEFNNHKILTSRDQNEDVNEWKLGFNVFF